MIHRVKKKERDERSTATGYATLKENQEYFSIVRIHARMILYKIYNFIRRRRSINCVGVKNHA